MNEKEIVNEMIAGYFRMALSNGAMAFHGAMTLEQIAKWVSEYDFMLAIFPDESDSGIGAIPVKGLDVFQATSAGELDKDLRCNAIPCPNRAVALEMLARFGKPEWANEFSADRPKKIN